ncbi:hypothetical protein AAV94_12435 [Lampropedia cohaerens]|uniref:Ammonia monooxygenase n=1 Tax=Lampropedia cohaerens TaxID=1610491 RepID=A0A0U1PXD8_9BURK|nr:AbrB family transcriptional regulator [Lampropedia cohaerens]KKW67126.1 hypothetical protein AAV94_12435 [Lampropedia cohaerens]
MPAAARIVIGLLLALMGAGLALAVGLPLPWLLGPLLVTAATRMMGWPGRCARPFNIFGRWMIGLALGLYFTPAVMASLKTQWPLVLLGAVYALALAGLGYWVLRRMAGLDAATAWFSAAIGSASEMASMAQRHGARVDQVASVHSLRVLLVVVIVPFAFQWWYGLPPNVMVAVPVQWGGLALLMAGAAVAGAVMQRLGVPSGWMMGALAFAGVLSVAGMPLSGLPPWLSWAGQLCIGWSLGDRYHPSFLRSAPRLMAVVAGTTLAFMAVSVVLAWIVTQVVDVPLGTLMLALAPGGIAEMTITAKVLNLGVPLVTAMHVTRLVVVVMTTGWLYRHFVRTRA